ncbi:hypothetical protein [Pseudoflavitalea rhizosphaerae]|uniref:hypothetical protein n=1 Tax=Pseudoflavitalea rhizosphaerae TaxID=1884793 RepID=UPI000F8DCD6E|nr:hypothetical protein [Pseudoflavitalea rhizosphaerae]
MPPLSAEQYIKSRSRTLKIERCLITADWETSRIAQVIVIRKHTNGNFTYAGYLVDLLCLGVKDTFYRFNEDEDQMEDKLSAYDQEIEMIEVDYPLAHNIIFAGNDLATEYNISQHPDFVNITRYLLEEDNEKTPLIEIHTGDEDGLPHLVVYPDNKQTLALARLKEHAGEGRFRYTVVTENKFQEDRDHLHEGNDREVDQALFYFWNRKEWESFIRGISEDNFHQLAREISYIYFNASTKPELEERGLDFDKMFVDARKAVNWEDSAEEQAWIHSNEEKLELRKLYDQLFMQEVSANQINSTIIALQEDIRRWPHNPIFRNYLYNAFLLLEDHKSAEAEMFETLRLFPDYLFAKTLYVEWLIKNNRLQDVPSVLDSKRNLSELYSHRSTFHVNEFMHFNSAWLYYYIYKADYCMADFYGKLLESLPDPLLRGLQRKLLDLLVTRRILDGLKIVSLAQNSSTEMDYLTRLLVDA